MPLPRLRHNLNIMPSPDPQRPGLFLRDLYKYSDAWMILPPILVHGLKFFDGTRTEAELAIELTRQANQGDMQHAARQLAEHLDRAGFLETETYIKLRDDKIQSFQQNPFRLAAHAGTAYSKDPKELSEKIKNYFLENRHTKDNLIGIAAPHVSLNGGWQSYAAAYAALPQNLEDKTFVILGTSHYGQPNRFGLTRKPFETPLGITRIDHDLIDELAREPAALVEDYCHAIEHSIELQVIFLQALYGPTIRILPLLCGPYVAAGAPDQDDGVRRFLNVLGNMATRDANKLFWILGIDMAHQGKRYGDRFNADADHNEMLEIRERDMQRIECIQQGNADGFWDLIHENRDGSSRDALRWCGSSPLYTFMKSLPQARASLERYEQWNIDPQSVVSFAGMTFTGA